MRVTNTPAPPDASPDLWCQRFKEPLLWRIFLWLVSVLLMGTVVYSPVGLYFAYWACKYVEVSGRGVVIGRWKKRRLAWSEIEEVTLVLIEPGYFAPQLTLASGETIVLRVVCGHGEGERSRGVRVVRAIRSGLKSHYDLRIERL